MASKRRLDIPFLQTRSTDMSEKLPHHTALLGVG